MRAAVVGTFDGVHRGHQHLLDFLKREADKRGLQPLALTFSSHPLALIDPARVPLALIPVKERVRLLGQQGVETAVLEFDFELRQMTASEFLTMLRRDYDVRLFVLGFNNSIGADRVSASSAELKDIAEAVGVEILVADECAASGVSSSAIRQALAQGGIEDVNEMLGRYYAIEGEVVTGRQLGRTIGFPTANICVPEGCALPSVGVYAGRALGHCAVINIGRRPTVECCCNAPLSIEVFIIDYSGNLYGQTLRVELLKRLRGEKKFGSLDELKSAIAADISCAKEL